MAKHVTFTGADDGTRCVDLDDRLFELGVEVSNVSDENVARLKAIDGLHFRVTDPSSKGDKKED